MANIRRQLRSGTVVLGGMGLLAAALTACDSEPDKRCVDRGSYQVGKGYKVVSDKNCGSGKTLVNGSWYYDGTKKEGRVTGGSFTKPRTSSGGYHGGVHRGGFGGHEGSHGG
ncbi:hypothetical protein [Streptomyces sp. NPDC046805]|uniref:hypothetical protein n=1 Tax=Streptomyces sp. NPDC046805 TaxID=3155134 RepID=UPI0033CB490D